RVKRMGYWIGLGVALAAALDVLFTYLRPASLPDAAPPPASRPLGVISFNVQFLPGLGRLLNRRPDAEYRARTIGRLLADYDVIGLEEVSDPGRRKLLLPALRARRGADFPCATPPDSERPAFGIGSGLVLVSRLPVVASHSLRYGNDSSVWRHG